MDRKFSPVKICNKVWSRAVDLITPEQVCIVIVNEAPQISDVPGGLLAFRHNCGSIADLSMVLRALADKLDAGETRDLLTAVPDPPPPAG
jgi:hypothetical protein